MSIRPNATTNVIFSSYRNLYYLDFNMCTNFLNHSSGVKCIATFTHYNTQVVSLAIDMWIWWKNFHFHGFSLKWSIKKNYLRLSQKEIFSIQFRIISSIFKVVNNMNCEIACLKRYIVYVFMKWNLMNYKENQNTFYIEQY